MPTPARPGWSSSRAATRDDLRKRTPAITQRAEYIALKDSKTKILNGQDYDVFGDGTVVVKAPYGHTPGHQVLYLKLRQAGPILLAGDLYHYQE